MYTVSSEVAQTVKASKGLESSFPGPCDWIIDNDVIKICVFNMMTNTGEIKVLRGGGVKKN